MQCVVPSDVVRRNYVYAVSPIYYHGGHNTPLLNLGQEGYTILNSQLSTNNYKKE
jgi:hypothetical protein